MSGHDSRHFSSSESAREAARAALGPRPQAVISPNWDRFVAAMRVMLPIISVVLAAVTIGWPFLNDTEVSFNLSKDEVAQSDGKIRMTDLRYVGTDAVDRLFRLEAKSGLQDDPGTPRIKLDAIKAEMQLNPDMDATVSAKSGLYRMEENTLALIGGVEILADNGYSLSMDGADIDLKAQIAKGEGNINGNAPLGRLTAQTMTLKVDEARGQFGGGIKIHITPKRPNG